MKNLSYYLMGYLTQYLSIERGCSANTISTYRYCFILLLRYLKQKGNKATCGNFDNLDRKTIIDFLDWIETTCKCSIQTRNNRLATIRGFVQYVALQDPTYLYLSQQVSVIPTKKSSSPLIDYFTIEETKILLSSINITVQDGLRNAAMLSLLYDSAARVQELCDLTIGDIDTSQYTVTLTGKGRKTRRIPIMKRTAHLISNYLKRRELSDTEKSSTILFPNRFGNKMTRAGITYIFNKYVEISGLANSGKFHPHCLRHSKAIHMLDSGIPLYYIRDFLGHSSIQTTEVYLQVSRTQIKTALESLNGSDIVPQGKKLSWQKSNDLYNWLCALGK